MQDTFISARFAEIVQDSQYNTKETCSGNNLCGGTTLLSTRQSVTSGQTPS